MRILVAGSTGYLGGRLVPELLARGHELRCLARRPERLRDAEWRSRVEVVPGDVSDPDTLADAMAEVDVAYYLVHSIGSGAFEETDRQGG